MTSQHYFTFPFYFPRLVHQIKDWPSYTANYVLRRERPAEYRLRNGHRLIDGEGTLAGTMAVVIVRREYGLPKDCRVIVDIGANMGAFSVYAALSCPAARVYCFEPDKRNFRLLKQNISANSLEDRVLPYQCAVASARGERNMSVTSSPMNTLLLDGSGGTYERVACVTLRDILHSLSSERVDLLKLNCEGAEYEILRGADSDAFERLPDIRLEYHNIDAAERNGGSLARFLKSQGYKIERFSDYKGVSGFIWAARS